METLQPPFKTILIVEDEFAVANALREILETAGYVVSGIAFTAGEAFELADQQRPDLVLLDIYLKGRQTGIEVARKLRENLIPFVYISANTGDSVMEEVKPTEPYGFIVKPFREKDVLVALEIAHYKHIHGMEVRIRLEQEFQLNLINTLSEDDDWEKRLLRVAQSFQQYIPFDYLQIGLQKTGSLGPFSSCGFFRTGLEEYQTITVDKFINMTGLTLEEYEDLIGKVNYGSRAIYNGADFEAACRTNPLELLIAKTFRLKSNLRLPLQTAQNGIFFLSFFSQEPDNYHPHHLEMLERLRPSLTLTVDRLIAFDKIEKLSEQLRRENTYLIEEVKTGANFEEIIGESRLLRNVFTTIAHIAPTEATVLIGGETGTGKELIARAIHNRSTRKGKPLIKINCAALPAQLIDSELFGHERGSFTGATEKRIGKFELANSGTIFLDEIGELPLDLQPKLLRVLQEKEIERVGGNKTIPCDVRIIAATNRNLQAEVAAGRFRADLFYRLNVFPVKIPSLRERTEDLIPLATYFLQKISKKLGKKLSGLSEDAIHQMHSYQWPGNVRELEHLLERAAIMSNTPVVSFVEPLVTKTEAPPIPVTPVSMIKRLKQAERENIIAALQVASYRIRGTGGAAEILQIKPTTLEARMAKLGISRNK